MFEQSECSPDDPTCLDMGKVAAAACAGVIAALGGPVLPDTKGLTPIEPEWYIACYKTENWEHGNYGPDMPDMICRVEQGVWDDIPPG